MSYKRLYLDSTPGIYQNEDTGDYYLVIYDRMVLIYYGKLSIVIGIDQYSKYRFVTDKYCVVGNNIIKFTDDLR